MYICFHMMWNPGCGRDPDHVETNVCRTLCKHASLFRYPCSMCQKWGWCHAWFQEWSLRDAHCQENRISENPFRCITSLHFPCSMRAYTPSISAFLGYLHWNESATYGNFLTQMEIRLAGHLLSCAKLSIHLCIYSKDLFKAKSAVYVCAHLCS